MNVTGQVLDVHVSDVNPDSNTATVAIRIVVETETGQALNAAVTTAIVTHVSDGDTLDVTWPTGATARVRLIGVDTPETVHPEKEVECYGPEASNYTKSLLPEGTQVSLQFDRQRLDPYGYTLAYVYTADGSQMINALLLEGGYARVLIVEPNSQHAALFYSLEDQAKADQIWNLLMNQENWYLPAAK